MLGPALALLSALSFATSGTFAASLMAIGWTPGAAVLARIGVAVEVNAELVPRSRLEQHPLAPGDRVEIIQAVGGG